MLLRVGVLKGVLVIVGTEVAVGATVLDGVGALVAAAGAVKMGVAVGGTASRKSPHIVKLSVLPGADVRTDT